MRRVPRGYEGINHETMGADILALLHSLSLPEQILGVELSRRLREVDPQRWYPIAWLLELVELVDQKVGNYGMRKIGRSIFKLTHQENLPGARQSARELLGMFDQLYHQVNRGVKIGGWRLLHFAPGRAELEKTTPHHCMVEEGLVSQALMSLGIPVLIEQPSCLQKGQDLCHFVITSTITDARWG
jgi:hypothetical protein